MRGIAVENLFANDFKRAPIDPGITYPCCKSFDEFTDVARLRSLDADINEKINKHIEKRREDYFINLYRLSTETPYQSGVREIWLSRPRAGLSSGHLDPVDRAEVRELTENAVGFAALDAVYRNAAVRFDGQDAHYL